MESKEHIEQRVEKMLQEKNLRIADRDFQKPWGGYFVIADEDTQLFIDTFFPEQKEIFRGVSQKLSPKILVVEPSLRLSWQYHDRRAEHHMVLEGPVAYPLSETDEQGEQTIYTAGDLVRIPQGTRHRLVGLDGWGVVAEIWEHTDPSWPSDESDNHRVQDDFNRA